MSAIGYKVKLTRADDTFVRFLIMRIPIADDVTASAVSNFAENLHLLAEPAFAVANLPFNPKYTCWGYKQTQTVDFLVNGAAFFGYLDVLDGPSVLPNNGDKLWFGENHYVSFAIRSEGNYTLTFYKNGTAVYTGVWWPTHARCSSSFGAWFIGFDSFPWLNNKNRLCTIYSDNQFYYSNDAYTLGGVRTVGVLATDLTNNQQALSWWLDLPDPIDLDDPYQDIPDSTPSGPAEGTGIPDTAGIDIPSLPTVSILDTGFINLFNPTLAQVQGLADYMWSAGFDVATFKKLFADPMDCILGFNLVPVNVPSGSPATIMVGNIPTTVTMNVATSQWVELNCGNINIDKAYGSYLDFAPYSKFSLYLPYIGTVELSTDDVVGRTLTLVYHVDVLSCSCVAYLKCGPDTLYQFTGSCGYSVPLTGQNFREMVGAIIDLAVNLGGVMAGGNAVAGVGAIAKDVMNLKPTIHRSGAIGASAGIMGIQTPYLIMELPNACKPKKQYHYTGYPGFITVKIGDLTGYAEFEKVILDGIGCTSEERTMIEGLLKGGVYV